LVLHVSSCCKSGETVARLGAHHSVTNRREKPNVFNDNVVGEKQGASCCAEGTFFRAAPDYEEGDLQAGL
jgi:hypothetical protein